MSRNVEEQKWSNDKTIPNEKKTKPYRGPAGTEGYRKQKDERAYSANKMAPKQEALNQWGYPKESYVPKKDSWTHLSAEEKRREGVPANSVGGNNLREHWSDIAKTHKTKYGGRGVSKYKPSVNLGGTYR